MRIIIFVFAAFALAFAQLPEDSLNMHLVGELELPGDVIHIAVQGSIVYVCARADVYYHDTLYIINIGDPESPEILRKFSADTFACWNLVVDDDVLCMTQGRLLRIMDISDINSAAFVGSLTVDDGWAGYGAWVSNGIVIGSNAYRTYYANISEPDSPYVITSNEMGVCYFSDTLLYVGWFKPPDPSDIGYDTLFDLPAYKVYSVSHLISDSSFIEVDSVWWETFGWHPEWWWTDSSTLVTGIGTSIAKIVAKRDTEYVSVRYNWTDDTILVFAKDCGRFLYELTDEFPVWTTAYDVYGDYLLVSGGKWVEGELYGYKSVWDISSACEPELIGYYRCSGLSFFTSVSGSLYVVNVRENRLKIIKVDSVYLNVGYMDKRIIDSVRVYPDPVFSGRFAYDGPAGYLYDVSGRVVREIRGGGYVDVSDLPAGVYFVKPKGVVRGKKILLIK